MAGGLVALLDDVAAIAKLAAASLDDVAGASARAGAKAAGVVIEDGKVLLDRRKGSGHLGGTWEFPGGKIEAGESAAQALVRDRLGEEVEERQQHERDGAHHGQLNSVVL